MPERNHKTDAPGDPLNQIKLHSLMGISSGSPEVVIGMIDGPVDFTHPALQGSRIRTAKESQLGACKMADSAACMHGTFVAGILCAKRGGSAPAICPDCEVVLRPVFIEGTSNRVLPTSTPEELATAIIETVDAGARIINLSLGLAASSLRAYRNLEEAYNYARQRGVILVAASGNQGNIGYTPLLNHPWIIPVAAYDEQGRLSPESNIGPSIGKRGVMAAGANITSTSPGGQYTQMSGTSVAAPFVTGAIALLWSEFPKATAAEVRYSIITAAASRRRTITPPILNAEAAWNVLRTTHQQPNYERRITVSDEQRPEELTQQTQADSAAVSPAQEERRIEMSEEQRPEELTQQTRADSAAVSPAQEPEGPPEMPPLLGEDAGAPGVAPPPLPGARSCPTCGWGIPSGAEVQPFIYALGTIQVRFPTPAVEKEFAQAAKEGETANLTDTQVIHNILKENWYLAREVCWVLAIENIETYILMPTCPRDLEQLIEAVKLPETRGADCDVVIGIRGPIAPPEMCNGLMVPIVAFDRIYSFEVPALIEAIPKPEKIKVAAFRPAAEELFYRIMQMADNTGAMDEHRALNYLAVRYPAIYDLTADRYANDFSLTVVEVIPSRLSGVRKLVDVVLSYTNRNTDVIEKHYVRVDVTEKYPFLVSKLAPFYDR